MKQHNITIKRMLLFTLLALGACFLSIKEASATHAYGGQLKWQQAGGNKIQFTFTSTWRRSFFGSPTVGQTISGIGSINTGNGVSLPIVATVTAVDAVNDQLYATWSGTHTYSTTGNFIAQWDLCCRISSLLDGNNDQNTRFQTIVNVGPPYNNPPVSSLPNIVFVSVGQSAATFSIPGSDPDGNNITYRLSTSAESSLPTVSPAGFSLASNGVVTMNTTTRTLGQRFGVQVMIVDGFSKTPVDFIIQMVGASTPPFFVAPTPMAPNNNITVLPGNNVNFTVSARDNDANSTVRLNAVPLPVGASITPTLPVTSAVNGTVSATFNWTPTSAQVGNYVLTFPAVDNVGVQALNTVNITVACALDAQLTSSFVNCGTNINATVTNFSSTANLLYSWSGPNGFTANTQNITNVAPGTYTLRVNDAGTGCLVVKNITVASSVPAPTITANGSTTICQGSSVTLTASAGSSYLWSNGATTQSINVNTPGNYTVTVTNASGCQSTSAATTVSYQTGLDTDGDGIPNTCDADDDNDGIPDAVECNKSNFFWSNPPTVSGNTATGVINGVSYTYTSSSPVETTSTVFAHNLFPTSYGIPNIQCIKNVNASNNTLTFATPVTNPILVFASIGGGQPSPTVPIEFTNPIDVLWSQNVVINSSTKITGTEGYAIVRLNGTYSSISFNYLASENWVNFLFGADIQSCGDTDGDGTPDYLDTDSDNDGCPDAIEGTQNPTMAQTANGRLTGGVDASGIPTLVNGGQGIGTSKNANANCFCQVNIDKTAPVITCPDNITANATSANGAVVNYAMPTATDNCAVTFTRTAGSASGATFPIGTTTVTYRATDEAGNFADCSFTVTVSGLAPQVVCPANIVVNNEPGKCGASVSFTATETTAIPASTITYSHASGSFFPVGVTTVTVTATNAVGSSTCTFTVTVKDNEAPSGGTSVTHAAPALALANVPEAAGYSLVYQLDVPNTANWDSQAQVPYTVNNAAALASTPFSRVAYLMDLGNKWVWVSFDKLTSDLTKIGIPTDYIQRTKVNNMNVFSSTGSGVTNGANIATGNIEFWPNCYGPAASNANIPTGNNTLYDFNDDYTAGSDDCYGSFQIHNYALGQTIMAYNRWSYGNGNSDIGIGNNGGGHPDWTYAQTTGNYTVKRIYVLISSGIPVLPEPTITLDANGKATLAVNQVDPGITDNCGVATSVLSKTDFDCTNLGANTVTLTVTDVNGNVYSGNTTVTVIDNIKPVITCPANVNVFATSAAGAVVNYTLPTATDNCAATVTLVSGPASGAVFPIGTTTVTYRAADAAGNTTDCSFTVTVTGLPPQIVSPGNQTASAAPGTCGAVVNFAATESTAIPASTITYSHQPGSVFPVGVTTVTATATNPVGTSQVTFTVTVTDNENPTIGGLNAVSVVANNGACFATGVALGTPTTADNCGVASVTNDAPTSYPVGNTTVTWTVTDIHGNSSTATQVVTVTDNQNPTIGGLSTITVNANNGACFATGVALGTPTTADNCGVASVTNDAPTSYPVGNTTVTWTVTDIHGNSTTTTQVVTVKDNQNPTIGGLSAITVNANNGACFATGVALGTPTTADNCGVASVTNDAPTSYPVGNTTVTWTVTDIHGNSTTTTQVVTVKDNQNPTIGSLSAITVNANNGACFATGVALGTPTTADNCGVASVTNDAPASYPVGNTTVTWTVTDIHGNSSTATQVVTVTDNQAPIVLTQNITINLDASGAASITTTQINNGSTDNCGIQTISLDKASFNCSNVGNNTVTLTVTDIHGNSASATATVTVVDNIKPTVQTPAAQTFCQNLAATYTVPAITVSDNCGIASVTFAITGATSRTGVGLNASGAFAVGNSTITWTVTDVNNNVTTVSVPVTVNPAPTATISASTPDAFCNKLTLTANSSSVITGYAWSVNSSAFANTQAIFLDNTNADGNYVVFVTDNKGCTSLLPVSYNYQKQNVISNYTILAYKEAELKEYNTVQTGSVGVMSRKGEAEIGKYSSVAAPGAFVKAPKIEAKSGSNVPTKIYAVATVTLPTMQYNSASVNNLPNFTTNQNATITLSGNYKNLTIRRGSNVVLTGNTYGNINIEEGSTVRFTSTSINVEHLKVGKGRDNGQTVVRFADNTSVRVAKHVQIEEDCFINPDSYKVTFYLGRQTNHSCNSHKGDDRDDDDHDRGHGDGDQKFEVKGGNTTVIANVYAPTGDIKVKGGESCHKNHVATTVRMTGLFIGYEVEGEGKNVIWNNYTCGSAMPMPIVNNTVLAVGEEQDADLKLDVKVLPNPTLTHFEMIVSSDDKETPVQIRVISGAGRVLNAMKATVGQRVQFGQEYTSGMYVAEVVQGNKRKTVKLIKGK